MGPKALVFTLAKRYSKSIEQISSHTAVVPNPATAVPFFILVFIAPNATMGI